MNAPQSRRRTRAAAVSILAALAVVGLGATSAQAANGFSFDPQHRLGGNTREDTAVATSKALYPDGGSDDVVLVGSNAVVDGLSASYLAGLKNAPILYSGPDALPQVTADEIDRLGASHIWIVGGYDRISLDLEKSLDKDYDVTRYAGNDRYETAAKVAVAGGAIQPERVYIASGTSLADAVTVAPVAWARNYPVLLTKQGSAPTATTDALKALGTVHRTVLGNSLAISDSTASALGATDRLGGDNRQATAVLVADDAVKTAGFTYSNAALVGGSNNNSVDALSAAAIAGDTGTPLLYIHGNSSLGDETTAYLKAHKADLDPINRSQGFVLGGTPSVPQPVVDQANAVVK